MVAVAWAVATRGLGTLLLCMSNRFEAGSGVNGASEAQEEELFRCTDLSLHGRNFKAWPLQDEGCAGVLSYGVSILRLGQDYGYMFLPGNQRPRIDVYSTTVPNFNKTAASTAAVRLTQSRIESLIKVGAQYEVCIF